MEEIDYGAPFWILTDETNTRPYTLHSPSYEELIIFTSLELAQRTAVQSERFSGVKLAPMQLDTSTKHFVDFIKRLNNHGIGAVTFAREGLPAITVSISSLIDRFSSSNGG